jgi:hypothetical protein
MPHNLLHNELINHGWITTNDNASKVIYKHPRNTHLAAYNEFILDYQSPCEVAITVPMPSNSVAYRHTFPLEDVSVVQTYLQLHIANNRPKA